MNTTKWKATGKNLGSVHYGVPPEVWVRRCRGVAFGFARSHSGSMAEQVAAEAIAKIWRQQQRGKKPVGFKPDGVPCNLFKTIRTVFYDSLRKESLHGKGIDPDDALRRGLVKKVRPEADERLDALARVHPEPSLGGAESTIRSIQWSEVKAVLGGDVLTDRMKSCVMAHFLEGKSKETVAEEVGVSVATVRKSIKNALRLIRQELGVAV